MLNKRNYYHPDLTDEEVSILRFLRQEADRCEGEVRIDRPNNNSWQRLWYARENLARYVTQLRKNGKNL
jgi:hypothetical protein